MCIRNNRYKKNNNKSYLPLPRIKHLFRDRYILIRHYNSRYIDSYHTAVLDEQSYHMDKQYQFYTIPNNR